jgi:glycosyltransferase involved in cell wall biosynthesis
VYLHGGIERVLSIKANFLANKEDYRISIITSEQKGKAACYDFDQDIAFTDLNINYNRKKSYFHPENLIKVPLHIYRLKRRISRLKPDVIVVCSHSTDTFFVPLVFSQTPTVKEFHYSKFIEIKKRANPDGFLKKLFLKFSDYIECRYTKLVVLNKDEAEYYRSENVAIIPNPATFNLDHLPLQREKVAIAAGRIAQVKGFEMMIEAWSRIFPMAKEWELHIYGEGEETYKTELQEKIRKLGLDKTVFLKGQTNKLQEKLLSAGIYLMTSRNECFPLVLLEAQACGLPVVAYDCPHGPRNILDGESGILIPMGNAEMFSNAVLKLMRDHDSLEDLRKKAQENVKKYRLNEVMPLWEAMFRKLVAKTG